MALDAPVGKFVILIQPFAAPLVGLVELTEGVGNAAQGSVPQSVGGVPPKTMQISAWSKPGKAG